MNRKKRVFAAAFLMMMGLIVMTTPSEVAAKKKATKFTLVPSATGWTRKSVKVSVTLKKGTKVKEIRWRKGKVTKKSNKYWKKGKTITGKKAFSASTNGWYSVRLKNKWGKCSIKTIQISCIDKTAPSVKTSYTVANKVGTVSVSAWDSNGISYIGYQKGWMQSKRKADYVAMTGGQNSFQVTTPGYYTVCVKDSVGNTYLAYQYVQLWVDLWNVTPFDESGGSNYKGTKEDRWGNSITNPIKIYTSPSGSCYIEYYLGGYCNKLSGNIVRSSEISDNVKAWVKIMADDVVLYQSPKMDYKSKPVAFDIELNHAKYVKIVAYNNDSDCDYGDMLITDAKIYN